MRSPVRYLIRSIVVFFGLLSTGTAPVLAQSDGGSDGGALGDIIINAIQELIPQPRY